MKDYSKSKLHFRMTIQNFYHILLLMCCGGGLIALLTVVKDEGKVFTIIGFLILMMNLSFGILMVTFFKSRTPAIQNFKIGSYAKIHSIVDYYGGIHLVVSSADASPDDVHIISVDPEFWDELKRNDSEEKWKQNSFVVRFVDHTKDISLLDQEEGIIPIVLTRCISILKPTSMTSHTFAQPSS